MPKQAVMRHFALATDYDGTIAHHGAVDDDTLAALERLKASGRSLLLVTGRELDELTEVFPHLDLFDRVVAENGALLYSPVSKEERCLAEPPPARFIDELKARGVRPISVGRVIVATWEPHETTVIETIRDLGLELQIIFNKGAVMVLPSGVNKATGLSAALEELGLSPHNVVGIGDAENDHAFLNLCQCSVAVANALDQIKQRCDYVTERDHGAGVTQLINQLLADDLAEIVARSARHQLVLGQRANGQDFRLPSLGETVLVAGPSGGGKSTLSSSLLERLDEAGLQYCIIDPEGDYSGLDTAIVLGDKSQAPNEAAMMDVLAKPSQNLVVNLIGLPLDSRPAFFDSLLPRILELRARTGRPHWLVIDEAHHLLPSTWDRSDLIVPQTWGGALLITVHPEHVAKAALATVNVVMAVGDAPERTFAAFAQASERRVGRAPSGALERGEIMAWLVDQPNASEPMARFRPTPPKAERRRHSRKYMEGDLGPDRSFYFVGRQGRLNLKAQNLALFMQIGEGIDDETWLFHLRNGDYSRWFGEVIKNKDLAAEAARVEITADGQADESRQKIREMIERYYTAPE